MRTKADRSEFPIPSLSPSHLEAWRGDNTLNFLGSVSLPEHQRSCYIELQCINEAGRVEERQAASDKKLAVARTELKKACKMELDVEKLALLEGESSDLRAKVAQLETDVKTLTEKNANFGSRVGDLLMWREWMMTHGLEGVYRKLRNTSVDGKLFVDKVIEAIKCSIVREDDEDALRGDLMRLYASYVALDVGPYLATLPKDLTPDALTNW